MRFLFVTLFVLFPALFLEGQRFRVATWNIENAFDTLHDEGKNDWEFLPSAEREWNSGRYWRKLRGISQTIAAMELPVLVGLNPFSTAGTLKAFQCNKENIFGLYKSATSTPRSSGEFVTRYL